MPRRKTKTITKRSHPPPTLLPCVLFSGQESHVQEQVECISMKQDKAARDAIAKRRIERRTQSKRHFVKKRTPHKSLQPISIPEESKKMETYSVNSEAEKVSETKDAQNQDKGDQVDRADKADARDCEGDEQQISS